MLGFLENMLDDGMRTTQRIMRERQVSYEEAHRLAVTECDECNGSGWIGHGMGGDTCGKCGGRSLS